jgi:hypothetical protein
MIGNKMKMFPRNRGVFPEKQGVFLFSPLKTTSAKKNFKGVANLIKN